MILLENSICLGKSCGDLILFPGNIITKTRFA